MDKTEKKKIEDKEQIHGNLRESIYLSLRDAITFGEILPGEQIFEDVIAKRFNVSRTPVREAIRQLQMEGYINVIPYVGAFVTKISPKNVEDIYDILIILEGYAVWEAIPKIKPRDLKQLKTLHNKITLAAQKNDVGEYYKNNIKFHMKFVELSGNEQLKDVLSLLRNKIYRTHYIGITIPGHFEEYITDHTQILDAISKGDREMAKRYMEDHIRRTKVILVDYLKRTQEQPSIIYWDYEK